jgi:hypothetical protein
MRAYKFLDGDDRAVFSGFRWPVPGPGEEAGPWVEAEAVRLCREGIHGCRPSDLGFWINEELWEIELDGEVVEADAKVVASRGRLRRRIDEWAGGAAREFAEATVFRARDTAIAFCGHGSGIGSPELEALASCPEYDELEARALAAFDRLPAGSHEQTSVGFVIDAARFLEVHICHAPWISACAGGHAASARSGDRSDWEAAVAAERAWQSAWITDRLALS